MWAQVKEAKIIITDGQHTFSRQWVLQSWQQHQKNKKKLDLKIKVKKKNSIGLYPVSGTEIADIDDKGIKEKVDVFLGPKKLINK